VRILVTGASGFVGRRLCTVLVSAGHQVVAPVRSDEARARVPGEVDTVVVSNPLDPGAVTSLLDGVEAVVHLAARVHVMAETEADPLAEFRRINVDGTRKVVAAAQGAGIRHLLYLSTIKVNGETREGPYTESDVPRPVDAYAQSKLEAEDVVRSAERGLAWTIIRPPLVYGPGVGGNFRRLLRLADVAGRWPLPLGGLENLRSMIFVDNLVDAMISALTHPAAQGQTFLVSDGHDVGMSELLRRLATALGGRPRLFRAPLALIRHAGWLLGRQADLDRVLGTLRIDSRMIQSTLGWRPPVDLAAGLLGTAQWWRDQGAR